MLAKIVLKANYATNVALATDVKYILTGGTDKTQLNSSAVDMNQTEFFTGVHTSGWTLHDTVNTSVFVVKAPISDDPTKFAYVRVEANSINSLYFTLYETWNNVSHTGTYATDIAMLGSISNAQGRTLVIHVTQKSIVAGALSFGYAQIGSNELMMISERTRLSPWDTVANGYIPYGIIGHNTSGQGFHQTLRIPYADGSDVAATAPLSARGMRNFSPLRSVPAENPASGSIAFNATADTAPGNCGASTIYSASQLPINKNFKRSDVLIPFGGAGMYAGGFPQQTYHVLGGYYSPNSDFWGLSYGKICANGDDIVSNDGTYMLFCTSLGNVVYALRKG